VKRGGVLNHVDSSKPESSYVLEKTGYLLMLDTEVVVFVPMLLKPY